MIVNIYYETIHLKTPADVEKRLDEIERLEVFQFLFNMENWFPYYQFIMMAYSIDSPWSHTNDDWNLTKRRIAAEIGMIHDNTLTHVLAMEDPNFSRALSSYLEYQCEREYTHLIMLKETYSQMIEYNLYTDGDMEQKARNVKHCKSIYQEIKDFEDIVRQKLGKNVSKDHKALLKNLPKEKHTGGMLSLEALITKD